MKTNKSSIVLIVTVIILLFITSLHSEYACAAKVEFSYDLHGNLEQVTDPEGNITKFRWDDSGRLVKRESPDSGITFYAYDAASNLVAQKNADNVTVNYHYDALKRLTDINFPDSAQNISFTYDLGDYAKGRLSGVTFSSGSQSFAYNADGRLAGVTTNIDGQFHTYAYEYHASGQSEKINLNSGLVVEYAAIQRIKNWR